MNHLPENFNSYLKYRCNEIKIYMVTLSELTSIQNSTLSRILSNNYPIRNDKQLQVLCNNLKLNILTVTKGDSKFITQFDRFIEAVIYIKENRLVLGDKIIRLKNKYKNHPYILIIELTNFIYKSIKREYDSSFYKSLDCMNKYARSFDSKYKKIFLTFYFGYLSNKRLDMENENVFNKIYLTNNYVDIELENLLNYYYFSYSWHKGLLYKSLEMYEKCLNHYKLTNNYNRLINLDMLYSNFLQNIGSINESIENNKRILSINEKIHTENHLIIINNIAWSYEVINDYKNAILYYDRLLNNRKDQELFFNIAFCHYKLNHKNETSKYIDLGLELKNVTEEYLRLLEWLDSMNNRNYSKKSFQLLRQIYKSHYDSFSKTMKQFLLVEQANYYIYNKEYENAAKYLKIIAENRIQTISNLIDFRQ